MKNFWDKIAVTSETECWLWLGAKTGRKPGQEYGSFRIGTKVKKPHRIMYELFYGEIPGSLCVLHECDNPLCVNPSHLKTGTIQDNNLDRDLKKRQVALRGEKHGLSKLTKESVNEIKQLHAWLYKKEKELAEKFNVSINTIRDIRYGRTWNIVE